MTLKTTSQAPRQPETLVFPTAYAPEQPTQDSAGAQNWPDGAATPFDSLLGQAVGEPSPLDDKPPEAGDALGQRETSPGQGWRTRRPQGRNEPGAVSPSAHTASAPEASELDRASQSTPLDSGASSEEASPEAQSDTGPEEKKQREKTATGDWRAAGLCEALLPWAAKPPTPEPPSGQQPLAAGTPAVTAPPQSANVTASSATNPPTPPHPGTSTTGLPQSSRARSLAVPAAKASPGQASAAADASPSLELRPVPVLQTSPPTPEPASPPAVAPTEATPPGAAGLSPLPTGIARVAFPAPAQKPALGPEASKPADLTTAPATQSPGTRGQPELAQALPAARLASRPENGLRAEVPLSGAESQPLNQFQAPVPQSQAPAEAQLPKAAPVVRLFQDIVHEAAVVRRFQGDSVAVVLKPDAHTEISLHLTLKNGEVEAAARCERGDFNQLSLHWPELRQSLQQHGVRLQELSSADEPTFGTSSGSSDFGGQNPRQFVPPEDSSLGFVPKLAAAIPAAHPKPEAKSPHRLLESWA